MFPSSALLRTFVRPTRVLLLTLLLLAVRCATAQDIHLHLPKRSKPTPVQKLNQDGVRAVQKHDYERAKKLFYKAYLLDPNDPFTLNNLGYVAELEGEIDRAQRFYALAAEQPSEAVIAHSSNPAVKGKEVAEVAGNAADTPMQVNRANVYAMGLLMKDRAPEADLVLQKALKLDPKNPFTLNNLGFAKEKEGELEQAQQYYTQAANSGSNEPVIVTMNKSWRGKPIHEIASDNASAVQKLMRGEQSTEARVARLNLRGVSAINRNDRRLARDYFQQAYKLDPNNAFTLNNMGYLAEADGDRETAEFYYARAREAQKSDSKVALATKREMEGLRMGAVAAANDQTITDEQEKYLEARRREGGPVQLLRRDNSPVKDPDKPVNPTKRESAEPILLPRDTGSGVTTSPGSGAQPAQGEPTTIPAQPNPNAPGTQPNSNPPPSSQPSNQPQAQPEPAIIEPLPDNQQPPNADKGLAPGTQPQQQVPPPQQPQSEQPQPEREQQVMPPLPDNQQPPNADKGQPTQQPPPQGQQQSNPPQ